jgi:glycerol uptake operon antiterminator
MERHMRTLANLPLTTTVIPIVDSRPAFEHALATHAGIIFIGRYNLFEVEALLRTRTGPRPALFIYADQMEGVSADQSGLRFLVEQVGIQGVISLRHNTLALAREVGLETIQRLFALDSTGWETARNAFVAAVAGMVEIAPALVLPYLGLPLAEQLGVPFLASGLVSNRHQIDRILATGARAVATPRRELWK